MAEFVEVMRQYGRMCGVERPRRCVSCKLSYGNNDMKLSCENFTMKYPEETEKIVLEWATEHPEPKYPSWNEAWKQLFPDSQYPDVPCLKYMLPSNHPQTCSVGCYECSTRPIPADIAEKLGIKPLEE